MKRTVLLRSNKVTLREPRDSKMFLKLKLQGEILVA